MNLYIYRALARGVILESVRRKDLWVDAILGFLIMVSAGALGFFGLSGLESFAKDLATTVVGIFSTIIAVMTTTRLMPEEIKNRTLYPLIARPVSRMNLLVGKLIGAVIVSWISFLLLIGLTALSLLVFRVQFEAVMAQYVVCKMLGLSVVCAVSLMFSLYMTPAASATMSCVFAFGGGMFARAMVLAYQTAPEPMQWIFKLLNACIPQYGLFDLGSRTANSGWGTVPMWIVAALACYALLYSTAMVTLGWLKFRNQPI